MLCGSLPYFGLLSIHFQMHSLTLKAGMKALLRPGGTGPADLATAGPIFSHEIEEVASIYKDDIDVSKLSTQLADFWNQLL